MKEEKVSLSDETIEKLADIIIKKANLNQPIYVNEPLSSNIPPGCRYCPNHPSNGGSGVCHCVLGIQTIT